MWAYATGDRTKCATYDPMTAKITAQNWARMMSEMARIATVSTASAHRTNRVLNPLIDDCLVHQITPRWTRLTTRAIGIVVATTMPRAIERGTDPCVPLGVKRAIVPSTPHTATSTAMVTRTCHSRIRTCLRT